MPAAGKITPRKYSVTDDVHMRVNLLALKRGKSVGSIVNDILDRNLPQLQITERG